MSESNKSSHLIQLGSNVALPETPQPAVRFIQPEFALLCPLTGQRDIAHLVIDDVPDQAVSAYRGRQ